MIDYINLIISDKDKYIIHLLKCFRLFSISKVDWKQSSVILIDILFDILSDILLTYLLSLFLTFFLVYLLTFCLAFFLTYLLAFYLTYLVIFFLIYLSENLSDIS